MMRYQVSNKAWAVFQTAVRNEQRRINRKLDEIVIRNFGSKAKRDAIVRSK